MQTAFIYDDVPRCAAQFTGKERDTAAGETGLDFFGARYYASTLGRWMSPDWSASVAPVPYADLANPQSLNLYGYVGNNPVTGVDPDGHMSAQMDGWGTGGPRYRSLGSYRNVLQPLGAPFKPAFGLSGGVSAQ
jgi:RHS repeat-associated protein